MRVFELAKILNVSSQQIIKDLRRYHVQVDTHMASVDDKVCGKLMELYKKRRIAEEKKAEELKRKKEEEELRRQEEEERRRREEESERLRREEEERKRREEEKAKRLKEEEERRAKELERRSSKLAEVLQKRQIESRPPRPAVAEREKREVKGKKAKRGRAIKEKLTPSEKVQGPAIAERGFRHRKKGFEKKHGRIGVKEPTEEFLEKPRKRRIRPTIFVAQPKPTRGIIPALPQKPPITEKVISEKSKVIDLPGELTVREFAEKIGVPVAEVIKRLIDVGVTLTINQLISADLCELLAAEFGVEVKITEESDERDIAPFMVKERPERLVPRPPVVTVMGHVDHGKTTLLDRIRKTDVVGQEFGGITQHIGAYFVQTPGGNISFLDTPGHEAFTKMRARGAQVTDMVILVVAANDGVMPQTIEAINHARAAGVPIIVALNKIDLPEADVLKVKHELMKYELVPEEFGGDTIFVEISAKYGTNIEHLLEMILLQADIMELKANPDAPAVGVIIESHIDAERGPLATVLVQSGMLKAGDVFVAGTQLGKVRAMRDDYGRAIYSAAPSFPVEITGFNGVPEVGEIFVVLPNERVARRIVEVRKNRRRRRAILAFGERRITLESLHQFVKEGKIKELRLILKGDVQGSIEAISESLKKLATSEVRVNIIHQGVGKINESDVDLAIASQAIIIGFNVVPDTKAKHLAELEKIDIRLYRVIYELIDDVKKALLGLLEPKYREVFRGRALVKRVFKISSVGNVAGCLVEEGEININDKLRLIRDGKNIFEGTVSSLRRVKEDVSSVKAGTECGIKIANYDDVKEDDILETYQLEEIKPTLGFDV